MRPPSTTACPLQFDAEICNGCNICVEVCQVDVLLPNPQKGAPPIIAFPGECWHEGSCVDSCPKAGAIRFVPLLINRVHFKPAKPESD